MRNNYPLLGTKSLKVKKIGDIIRGDQENDTRLEYVTGESNLTLFPGKCRLTSAINRCIAPLFWLGEGDMIIMQIVWACYFILSVPI